MIIGSRLAWKASVLETGLGFESPPLRQLGNVFVGSPSARARQPILSANWNFLSFKMKFEPIFLEMLDFLIVALR